MFFHYGDGQEDGSLAIKNEKSLPFDKLFCGLNTLSAFCVIGIIAFCTG